jgi:PAS domain S-box-containing protein
MSREEVLGRTTAHLSSSLPTNAIVVQSWQRSQCAGVERDQPPSFRRVGGDELKRRQSENRALLAAAVPHVRWLSQWFQQRPHVVYLVDRDGIVLHAEGDADAIERYALSPGFDWSESVMGTNGAGTALAAGVPVAVIGCEHWSHWWKNATCLGAPILGRDRRPLGAIDISMDVREGDAERLVVAAHVAYTISLELGRSEVEAEKRETYGLYETTCAALDAERRARADAEAALARQQHAETALRENEERVSLAFDNAAMGMWELDLATGACAWSEQTGPLFGLPRGANAGTLARFLELIHPDDREAILRATSAAAEGADYEVEFRTTWPDGTVRWINGKGRVAVSRDGRGPRLIGIGQDITLRKEAEAALRISEHRLQTIIDSTPALVYVVDATHRFRLINRRFGALFGIDVHDAIGRSIYDYFPSDVADQFVSNNEHALQTRRICESEEVVPQTDGVHTYISVKAPLYDAQGAPYAICGVSTDITERKRLTSALEIAHRQKDAFLATVVHELRQPLGAIQAALALMRTRIDREKGERARAVIERQIAQLSRLVEDLLDASRITQGKVTLRRARTTLQDVLEAAITVVQPLIRERGQDFHLQMPSVAIWLDADVTRLQQVFSNLLINAAKFTDTGGRIDVVVSADAHAVAVHVRDTGRGIAPELLPQVFELFTQADSSLARSRGGLGIGLTLVRALVELHGGQVSAESAGPGNGSEFVVRLPLAHAVRPRPHAAPPPAGFASRRVLIIEDNRDACEMLRMALEMEGHNVHTASTGPQGVQAARSLAPDVVLVDVGLPGLDGYEVARRIRKGLGDAVMLVALTGYGDPEAKQRAWGAGFDVYLVKPVDPPELARLVAAGRRPAKL